MTVTASGGSSAANSIRQVAVVIPAHNEEQHLKRALTAARDAADQAESNLTGVRVQVVVVLDSCTDGSAAVAAVFAAEDPRYMVLPVDFRSVGKSRQAGAGAALENATRRSPAGGSTAGSSLRQVWLANTDADS